MPDLNHGLEDIMPILVHQGYKQKSHSAPLNSYWLGLNFQAQGKIELQDSRLRQNLRDKSL